MEMSIEFTWSAGALDGTAEERGISAGKRHFKMTGADVADEIGTDLSRVPPEGIEQ